jgi:hypothetical protein
VEIIKIEAVTVTREGTDDPNNYIREAAATVGATVEAVNTVGDRERRATSVINHTAGL